MPGLASMKHPILLTPDNSRMEDIFRKLSAGARFSSKDLKSERKRIKASPKPIPIETVDLDPELDFFGTKIETLPPPPLPLETTTTFKKKKSRRTTFKSIADIRAFRGEKDIRVYGVDIPSPVKRFTDLSLPETLLHTLKMTGLKKPTSVQMQATSILLSGRDAFVVAPTGSGKTLVFVLAILSRLLQCEAREGSIEALIISPTRELAAQIRDEFRRFTPVGSDGRAIVGSVLLNKAVLNSWKVRPPKKSPAILITTPKRLVQGVEGKVIDLSRTKQIMLDEADKLLELGLMEQIDDILAACTFSDGPIQKALFSATIPSGVEDMARSFMNEDPIRVVIGRQNAATRTIKQKLVYVGQEEGKLMAIRQMLTKGIKPPVIIFTETIGRAQELFHELVKHGINVDMIHSSRSQTERERVIAQFRSGRIWFLITTELLARGLDFANIFCVINYDFPLSTASYIHRIGRTGRAGKRGKAITFFTKDDADALRIVANVMRESGCEVPEWMLNLERKKTKDIMKRRVQGH